jgi:anti-sigma-K factor RskA
MNDKIEKFIKCHRAEMDHKEPSPELWIDIANEISNNTKQKSLARSFVWWRAAAVILLLVTSLLVIEKYVTEPDGKEIVMSEQLIEAESYYISLIDQKQREVSSLSQQLESGKGFCQ